MTLDANILLVIIGSAVVTMIPRILPFIVIRKVTLPAIITKWLSFIPISILTALTVGSFIKQENAWISIDWSVLAAIVPTLIIAVWTKKLSVTVIAGIIIMAVIRLF
ncbi:AzlD domain-containing protein [Ferviditalea candida]|uniref:AzlD domain-containing protein n=1 Tax=Ferviditalea candida TaxID=3108399 RepID=A0ABU5ZJ90_9BACL|nr:AzlD domain-containing protein [Paenibacillaceae bacterium T2]